MCHFSFCFFFFFKQKPAYELRISDWSSDVCSSDLGLDAVCRLCGGGGVGQPQRARRQSQDRGGGSDADEAAASAYGGRHDGVRAIRKRGRARRSEERRVGTEWVSTCRSRGSQDP